jgi:hypothetical protein
MPESVTDRPTSAHEHVFLLTKRPTYFYDAEAVREDATSGREDMASKGMRTGLAYIQPVQQNGVVSNSVKLRPSVAKGGFGGKTANSAQPAFRADYGSRNLRNVWTIATQPFSEAHFATFPPALAERCIKAGSRPGDTILDPFAGAFTSLLVADRLQRHGIGIELNPTYAKMARNRLTKDAGMFAEIVG